MTVYLRYELKEDRCSNKNSEGKYEPFYSTILSVIRNLSADVQDENNFASE